MGTSKMSRNLDVLAEGLLSFQNHVNVVICSKMKVNLTEIQI